MKKGDRFHGRVTTVAYRPKDTSPQYRGEAEIDGVRFIVVVWVHERGESLSLGFEVQGPANEEDPEEFGLELSGEEEASCE